MFVEFIIYQQEFISLTLILFNGLGWNTNFEMYPSFNFTTE